jgi:SAM-dependent methyltransferase
VSDRSWEAVAACGDSSWYLDPLVAEQKRRKHLALLHQWSDAAQPGPILKTDLFEEANGSDELLSGFPRGVPIIGMDVAPSAVALARRRTGGGRVQFVATDVRRLGLASGSIGVVFSNSTLDHFETMDELVGSIGELVRVLKPGGTLIVTLDNPVNPLYGLLRWVCRRGWAPFVVGRTATLGELMDMMRQAGLDVTGSNYLIHNPRLVSTAMFIGLRHMLGRRADGLVRLLLALFDRLDRLPTRAYTACFVAAYGRKAEK